MIRLGRVCEVVRYPVKSMAGCATDAAFLGWHGLESDRRFAFRRIAEVGGFPWLSASRLPKLLLYHPIGLDEKNSEPLPTHVRTPSGSTLELRSIALQTEIAEQSGESVELLNFKHGIFDEAALSVICLATIAGIGQEAGVALDRRRFRANIVVETMNGEPFQEDGWIGRTLVFGEGNQRPAVCVTQKDPRCTMINIDPDTGAINGDALKAVVRRNKNNAGVYATVLRTGRIQVGDRVSISDQPPLEE